MFAEQGFDAPLEHIAKRAGVGIATLYRNFPTRGELLAEVAADSVAARLAVVERAAELADPWAGLVYLLEQACQACADDPCFHLAMTTDLPAGRASARLFELAGTILARAKAAGQLRADVTIGDLAAVLFGTGKVAEVLSGTAPDAWRRYLAMTLDGLRPAAASEPPVPPVSAEQLAAALAARGQQHAG